MSGSEDRTPPLDLLARLIVAALRGVLPRDSASDTLGDLVEDYRRRGRGRRRWLIAQAINLAWGFRRRRLLDVTERPPRAGRIDAWRRDARYAARSLLRSRGFAAVALGAVCASTIAW